MFGFSVFKTSKSFFVCVLDLGEGSFSLICKPNEAQRAKKNCFEMPESTLKMRILESDLGSGFEEPGSTAPPRIRRNTPLGGKSTPRLKHWTKLCSSPEPLIKMVTYISVNNY